jgi:hypothetical protein
MNGPEIATISVRRVPFDDGYSFEVDYFGCPLEDHPLAPHLYPGPLRASHIKLALEKIGHALDEIEQAGP